MFFHPNTSWNCHDWLALNPKTNFEMSTPRIGRTSFLKQPHMEGRVILKTLSASLVLPTMEPYAHAGLGLCVPHMSLTYSSWVNSAYQPPTGPGRLCSETPKSGRTTR